MDNYEKFLKTLLVILNKRKVNKKCNVFTTNYDGCLTLIADEILKIGSQDFILNDGGRGFSRRFLHTKNFNSSVIQSGLFDRYNSEIPQINVVHVHGSIYWYKDNESIFIDYSDRYKKRIITNKIFDNLKTFSPILEENRKKISNLPKVSLDPKGKSDFWKSYNELPIVNPTKWKFHQTVFEENYYQMLRMLSYELEKPNSILITFGFSFADEHILNLVKRSLSNPQLQVFISCFNDDEYKVLKKKFEKFENVKYLTSKNALDFTVFNDEFFNLSKDLNTSTEVPGVPTP